MADTQPAAEAPATNPAEVSKSNESTETVAKPETTASAESGDKEGANGTAEASKEAESSTKEKDDRSNGRQFDNRRGGRGGRGGGKFGGNKPFRKRNDEFENLPESDDPNEIRQQVEFYFSVANLATDEHLFKELEGPRNAPVSIKHISQFKRMRRFTPYSAIVNALRESEDLVVVDDGEFAGTGKEAVKRKDPLVVPKRDGDEEYPPTVDELFSRIYKKSLNKLENCIYAKGFAGEGEDVGQIPLEQFFRPYGAVMIRKRREEDGTWKGSVFVEFDTEESANQFLALDPKPKYNDNELTIMSKKDYSEMKCKEKGITPEWLKTEEERNSSGRGRGRGGFRGDRGGRGGRGGRGRGGRGGRGGRDRDDRRDRRDRRDRDGSADNDDWKKRRDNFQDRDSKKRSRDDNDAAGSPKRSKIEVKEDA
ncbi:hypothetical protein DPSP01_009997 [Paraphaeosphaeria sporulosa]|uniref:Uncharacterized protein n=1 Tax=Paraphaeosphaeria sporulosa TaxID=1460663 RepID=A0A177CGL2_9PLEO|nr:uncharacterized protein CC84DRAFT_1164386 [Paraphaeosphaeria sporulosa]OAG05978.1 hypothetical protein CC84DRAFT_1164386 [Paraphaeosphaeria sporulosa]